MPFKRKGTANAIAKACTDGQPVKHLIVEANGLSGLPSNWEVVNEFLREELPTHHYMIYASHANQRMATYQGIDTCGDRLVEEVEALVAQNPTLRYISLLGHSMGGLLVRYAAGHLYNPSTGLMAGLRPVHYISMATPHLGCDAFGESQVPLIEWMGGWKLLQSAVGGAAPVATRLMFRRTGSQFFLGDDGTPARRSAQPRRVRASSVSSHHVQDNGPGSVPEATPPSAGSDQSAQTPPASDNTAPNELALAAAPESGPPPANQPASLLLRLACSHEHPDDPQFIAALAAFQSRTCYANADGDHLVGWANSSLRFKSELPALDAHRPSVREKGVALADAADAGFASAQSGGAGSPKASSALGPEQARADAEGRNTAAHDTAATSGSALAGEGHHSGAASALQPRTAVASTSGGRFSASTDGAAATARLTTAADVRACSRAEKVSAMMENLRSMPWARVDCTWRGAKVSTFAHNHIQVTRRWLNLEGAGVCKHLAQRFTEMEREMAARDPAYDVAVVTGRPSHEQPRSHDLAAGRGLATPVAQAARGASSGRAAASP